MTTISPEIIQFVPMRPPHYWEALLNLLQTEKEKEQR